MPRLDSDYLLALARLKTVESRATLAETITDLFSEKGEFLSDWEREAMSAMLHAVVGDIEQALRRAFRERLKALPGCAPDLLARVADDRAEVAYPVLTQSPTLHAEELVEVVRHRALEQRLGLALRAAASRRAEEEAAATAEPGVAEALMRSAGERVAKAAATYVLDRSKEAESRKDPVVRRSELSPDLAKRMFLWVSAALRRHLIDHLGLDEDTVDEMMERVVAEQIRGIGEAPPPTGAERLADVLAEEGLIDHDLLLRTVTEGEIGLFVALFARTTGLRARLVRRILFEPGGEGLAIACKAIGVGREIFARVFAASRSARLQRDAMTRIETTRAVAFYDLLGLESAQRVVRKWRLSPDYAAAIRELQMASGPSA